MTTYILLAYLHGGAGRHSAFVSYFRKQSGEDSAELLLRAVERFTLRRAYRGDPNTVAELLTNMRNSEMHLLILSKHTLERPWILLEVLSSMEIGVPIVGAVLAGSGYEHGDTRRLMSNFEEELSRRNPEALGIIRANYRD